MNNGINLTKINENFGRARVSALSDDQTDDQMHTTSWKTKFGNYGNKADVMVTIAKSMIKGLIVVEADRVHAKRTQSKVQTQIA